jgi:DNA helicase-2/ATP-dependent DNA helicase PcrA
MIALVESFRTFPGSHLYRKELYFAILKTISESLRSDATLAEALVKVRENTRRLGRRLPRKAIARTLLVKGLEFDHAIVLNADKLDPRNLYVALTRAEKTVTIMSPIDVLTPNAN